MNDERRAFEKSEPSEHYCIAVCQCPAIGGIGSPFSCPFGPSCERPSVNSFIDCEVFTVRSQMVMYALPWLGPAL